MTKDIHGKRALVTGASSGLGVDFARELARRGADLVLVARREQALEQVAAELRRDHGVAVDVVAMDLGERDAPQRLYDTLEARGLSVDILVNNAGFGLHGPFLEIPWEREREMLELDIVTLVHMTKLFARGMAARGEGRIMQIASIGAYQASPTYASYSAAKRFVLDFGQAINHELKGTGVSCTVVSPGVTATQFLEVAGQKPTLYQRLVMMKSPQVARIGVRALLARRASIVTGWMNVLTAWFATLSPRCMSTALASRLMGR